MNKTNEEAVALVKELTPLVKDAEADVVVCPSFTVLKDVADELKGSNIKLGAQNMHYEDSGAFTGDVSPLMLKSVGCGYVILGHSDRREIFKEDDALIDKKVISALKHALKPILCVGENFDQKEKGIANDIIETQLKNCLKGLDNQQMKDVSIAYEPTWAISRGNPNVKPATKEDAEQRHQFVRSVLNNLFDENTSKNTRILDRNVYFWLDKKRSNWSDWY